MTTTLKIAVPQTQTRTWKTLEEVLKTFTPEEVVQIVHRYCDAQDHALKYRQRRAARIKAMTEMLTDQGVDVASLVDDAD